MPRVRLCFFAILTAIGAAGGIVWAAPLPFVLAAPDLPWRTIESNKSLNIGSTLEAMILSTTTEARFIVVSAVDDPTDGENLSSYAQKIKASLKPSHSVSAVEKTEEKFGFNGTDLTFEISDGKQGLACEVFTFINANRRWGLLYLVGKDEAQKIREPFAIFRPAPTIPVGVVGMTPFKVKDNPVTAFPISFNVKSDRIGARVERLTVTEVPPSSPTELAGVREGDVILSIDGKKASEFAIGLGKDSELGRIFLNRKPGDEVTLEFISPGDKKPQTVVLRIPTVIPKSTIWGGH